MARRRLLVLITLFVLALTVASTNPAHPLGLDARDQGVAGASEWTLSTAVTCSPGRDPDVNTMLPESPAYPSMLALNAMRQAACAGDVMPLATDPR